MANDAPLYNIASTRGESNLIGMQTALNHFDKFLTFMKDKEPNNVLPPTYFAVENAREFFTEEIIGKFACYMIHEVKIKCLESVYSYTSKLKSKLVMDYGAVELPFIADSNPFWSNLRFNMKKIYLGQCAKDGGTLVKSAPPMTKADQKVINALAGRVFVNLEPSYGFFA